MPYNLFIEHHEKLQSRKRRSGGEIGGIGTGWEDDSTNILSFYLSSDRNALENFCDLILDRDYEKPVSIETQQISNEGRPDIIINLSSGSSLIIECKVDASLQPNQLQRYLKIEPNPGHQTYVALISKRLSKQTSHLFPFSGSFSKPLTACIQASKLYSPSSRSIPSFLHERCTSKKRSWYSE